MLGLDTPLGELPMTEPKSPCLQSNLWPVFHGRIDLLSLAVGFSGEKLLAGSQAIPEL